MGNPAATEADSERELRRLAYRDHLTGLPNRASMRERIGSALEHAEREGTAVVVLFCDLDGIKLVNDTLGHTLGDHVLADVADRLRLLAGAGVTAGRHGGDEFLLLVEDLPGDRDAAIAEATELGRRLAAVFTPPFSAGGATFELTASAGAAVFPWHADDAATLIERADGAMYEAKRAGRAQTVVFDRVSARPYRELEATLRIRRALAAGELELHYQPVIEIADGGGLGGLEALLRWRDPDRGLVLPGDFLPLLDRSPLLEEISKWVFSQVCHQLQDWRERGFNPRVSFNVPARQLRRPGFADYILRVAEETGVDLTRIAAEITESASVDLEPVLPVLVKLRAAGLVLSLDDFGSGYASFARLRDMPFSLLKTDVSFMEGVPDDGTERQLERVLEIGVRVAQGYLFDAALPPEEIEARYGPAALVGQEA